LPTWSNLPKIKRGKLWLATKQPLRPCLVRKNFQDSPSHRIFGRMHGALNIDKNKKESATVAKKIKILQTKQGLSL